MYLKRLRYQKQYFLLEKSSSLVGEFIVSWEDSQSKVSHMTEVWSCWCKGKLLISFFLLPMDYVLNNNASLYWVFCKHLLVPCKKQEMPYRLNKITQRGLVLLRFYTSRDASNILFLNAWTDWTMRLDVRHLPELHQYYVREFAAVLQEQQEGFHPFL